MRPIRVNGKLGLPRWNAGTPQEKSRKWRKVHLTALVLILATTDVQNAGHKPYILHGKTERLIPAELCIFYCSANCATMLIGELSESSAHPLKDEAESG